MSFGRSFASALTVMLLLGAGASAIEPAAKPAGHDPDSLRAKAVLEELLIRRYSQGLATLVDRQAFSLGAQLDVDLVEEPQPAASEEDTPAELLLGTLDPEELMKRYSSADGAALEGFLADYRIRGVSVSVGLKEELAPETREMVEKWLTERLKAEFGEVAKGTVTFIRAPAAKPVAPKTLLDWLSQFQALAGQMMLALAILLGTVLWKILSSKSRAVVKNEGEGQSQSITVAAPASAPAQGAEVHGSGKAASTHETVDEGEASLAIREIRQLTRRLSALAPKLSNESNSVIRSWCQAGEEGMLKLACFAEAAGEEMTGRLEIPVDAHAGLAKVFAKMPELGPKEKADALKKAYWDLLMALNLGASALERPFGYLGGLKPRMVSQLLMDQNPKMKTLVALHMPGELRDSYMHSLGAEMKRELLQNAAQMTEIAVEELRSIDGSFRSKLQPGGNKESVSLDSALRKLIASLTPVDEATLLHGMTGTAIDDYKRSSASLAFLGSWPDDKLSLLLGEAHADEVVVLARVREDLKERLLSLCPPMTAEMVSDELSRPDTHKDKERNKALSGLLERMKQMIARKEVDLEEVFAAPSGSAQEAPDDLQKAA